MFVQEEILNLQNLIKKEIEFEKKLVSENTNLTIIEKKMERVHPLYFYPLKIGRTIQRIKYFKLQRF